MQQTKEHYRCWYEALQLSDRSLWAPHVEELMGAAAEAQTFEAWWDIFDKARGHVDRFHLHVIHDRAEYDHYVEDDDDTHVVIRVNLLEPKRDLQRAFRQLLKEVHPRKKAGRPIHEDIAYSFPLKTRVDPRTTESMLNDLATFVLWQAGVRPLWRIGVDLHLWSNYKPRELGKEKEAPNEGDKIVFNPIVSRHLTRAKALIRGVELGIFPARRADIPKADWDRRWRSNS